MQILTRLNRSSSKAVSIGLAGGLALDLNSNLSILYNLYCFSIISEYQIIPDNQMHHQYLSSFNVSGKFVTSWQGFNIARIHVA